jgi:hypothetical protein
MIRNQITLVKESSKYYQGYYCESPDRFSWVTKVFERASQMPHEVTSHRGRSAAAMRRALCQGGAVWEGRKSRADPGLGWLHVAPTTHSSRYEATSVDRTWQAPFALRWIGVGGVRVGFQSAWQARLAQQQRVEAGKYIEQVAARRHEQQPARGRRRGGGE